MDGHNQTTINPLGKAKILNRIGSKKPTPISYDINLCMKNKKNHP